MYYTLRRNAGCLFISFGMFVLCLSIIKLLRWDTKHPRFLCFNSAWNLAECPRDWKDAGTALDEARTEPLSPNDQKPIPGHQATTTTTLGMFTMTKTVTKPTATAGPLPDKAIVAGYVRHENTQWITQKLPDWQHFIYSVDNPRAKLHTLINKGHEALPYLTYIIDNYYNLPNTTAFIHAHESGWHVDNERGSNAVSLRHLQIPYVQEKGYVNLHCETSQHCSAVIKFDKKARREGGLYETEVPKIWQDFFPEQKLPKAIGVQCCGQFAVSRAQILKRSIGDYQTYLRYVLTTKRDDEESGRVMEQLWHIIFGANPVHCPEPDVCYCNNYGWCGGDDDDRLGENDPDMDLEYWTDIDYNDYNDDDLAAYVDRFREPLVRGHTPKQHSIVDAIPHFPGDDPEIRRPSVDVYGDDMDYGYGDSYDGLDDLEYYNNLRKGSIPDLDDGDLDNPDV